jgi:hypothetical protein
MLAPVYSTLHHLINNSVMRVHYGSISMKEIASCLTVTLFSSVALAQSTHSRAARPSGHAGSGAQERAVQPVHLHARREEDRGHVPVSPGTKPELHLYQGQPQVPPTHQLCSLGGKPRAHAAPQVDLASQTDIHCETTAGLGAPP